MFTSAAALYEAASLLRAFSIRRGIVHAIAAGVPIGLAVALVLALRYVDNSGSVVEVAVNRLALHDFWWVTFLSCGPVLIAGAIAVALDWRHPHNVGVFGALVIASTFFYFFVNVRDHQDVYVGWRVGHFLFMSAAGVLGPQFNEAHT